MDAASLADYRRQVAQAYAAYRAAANPAQAVAAFRRGRDDLFATHPQSALDADQKARFRGLSYAPFDPAYRITAPLLPTPAAPELRIELGEDGQLRLQRVGRVQVSLPNGEGSLDVYWLPVGQHQGRRPGHARGPSGAGFQPGLQPLVRLQPALGLPAGPPGQPPGLRGARG